MVNILGIERKFKGLRNKLFFAAVYFQQHYKYEQRVKKI